MPPACPLYPQQQTLVRGSPLAGQQGGTGLFLCAAVRTVREHPPRVTPGTDRNQPESGGPRGSYDCVELQGLNGAARRNRTSDPALTKGVLYL